MPDPLLFQLPLLTGDTNSIKLHFPLPHTTADGLMEGPTADICEKGGRMTTKFILRTDERGKRWEISLRADGTIVHRLEGDASWLDGWPPSLPSLKAIDAP